MPPPLPRFLAQDLQFKLTPTMLSKLLMREITRVFSVSSLLVVNSGTLRLCLCFSLAYDLNASKRGVLIQAPLHTKLITPSASLLKLSPPIFSSFLRPWLVHIAVNKILKNCTWELNPVLAKDVDGKDFAIVNIFAFYFSVTAFRSPFAANRKQFVTFITKF